MIKYLLTILAICVFGVPAYSYKLVKTFDPNLTYWPEHCGPQPNDRCVRPSCAGQNPEAAPDDCFTETRFHVIYMNDYAKDKEALRKFYSEKIAALEEQLRLHRDKIAINHREIANKLIADPQFKEVLFKKIYSDKK